MKTIKIGLICAILTLFISYENSLNASKKHGNKIMSTKKIFGKMPDGKQIYVYKIENRNGVTAEIINYGAILVTLNVPDKNGKMDDIVLGYDNLREYVNDPYYFGATVGRVANRTGGARFELKGKTYNLAPNTLPDFGKNHLHGGVKPFSKVVWEGKEFQKGDEIGVVFKYLSKDGEEGYPGNVNCQVTYSINNKNELKIEYHATTDQTTIVNMTHHSYFNLQGAGNNSVLDQQIQINANKYTVADDDLIPTGEIADVDGLPIDFKSSHTIGSRMHQMQEKKFTGYDLNYVLNHSAQSALDFAGKAFDQRSGRLLEVFTTQPCMHFYTANFLEGKPGKNGKKYLKYGAFCFEPQGYPDAVNKPQFDSIVLNPEEEYNQTIVYKFSTPKY